MPRTHVYATSQKEARYWIKEQLDNITVVDIKRKKFSHKDKHDGKRVYLYWVYYRPKIW